MSIRSIPLEIRRWKQVALEGMTESFTNGRQKRDKAHTELVEELYQQIGQLKVELRMAQKNLDTPVREPVCSIDRSHAVIPVTRQAKALRALPGPRCTTSRWWTWQN